MPSLPRSVRIPPYLRQVTYLRTGRGPRGARERKARSDIGRPPGPRRPPSSSFRSRAREQPGGRVGPMTADAGTSRAPAGLVEPERGGRGQVGRGRSGRSRGGRGNSGHQAHRTLFPNVP